MKTDYKVGDKVTILPFKAGTVGSRVYYQAMLQNIGLVGTVTMVHDDGVRVKTSGSTWSYHFKFIKPLEETSMTKPTAINVINQSPKVRARLSKALVSLGYDLDCDYGEGSNGNSTRIYNYHHNHDLGAVSSHISGSTVDADDLKFKAVLKAVIPLLEFSTERPQVGDKVVVLDNPENLDDVHVGIVGTVQRDDHSQDLPLQVTLPNNHWWFSLDSVRVLKAAEKVETSSVAVKAPADPELVHEEPKELQQADFKFTRVKVKDTGATGVVIGRGLSSRSVCVQFDMPSFALHNGGALQGYQGADNRCFFHVVEDLEIIGD